MIAGIWNIFDGEELLPWSVGQIRNNLDIRIAVVQSVSNTGETYIPGFNHSLFTHLVNFTPNLRLKPYENEVAKRNVGLRYARALGATHFINLDCDEVYHGDEFHKAKQFAIESGVDATFCRMRTYYRDAETRLAEIEPYFVPFICKLKPLSRYALNEKSMFYIDHTRKLSKVKSNYLFESFKMHHFSWVRRDIGLKLRNSSSVEYRKNAAQMVADFNAGKLVHFAGSLEKCANEFKISL
jgi:hypothetical protein